MLKSVATMLLLICTVAEASIFWEKLKSFFGNLTIAKFQEVIAW
jgi:hypothetical protein